MSLEKFSFKKYEKSSFRGFVIFLLLILCVSFGFAISTVTHSGSDIFVTFGAATVTVQNALASLAQAVHDGSQPLYNACLLRAMPSPIVGDDINNIPASFDYPTPGGIPQGKIGNHARQVIVSIGNQQMSAQAALDGISSQLTYVKNNKLSLPCQAYCSGNKDVSAGICDGAGSCGSAYENPDVSNWCQYGCASGSCKSQAPDTCSGDTVVQNYQCTSNDPSSCDYQTKTDCTATGQVCQKAQCVTAPNNNNNNNGGNNNNNGNSNNNNNANNGPAVNNYHPVGSVSESGTTFLGTATDQDSPSFAVHVHIYVDGKFVSAVAANGGSFSVDESQLGISSGSCTSLNFYGIDVDSASISNDGSTMANGQNPDLTGSPLQSSGCSSSSQQTQQNQAQQTKIQQQAIDAQCSSSSSYYDPVLKRKVLCP